MNEIVKSKVFKLSHEIAKRNVFARNYKKTALKKAWEIVKLKSYICNKCYKIAKNYSLSDKEKESNLKSILNYVNMFYDLVTKYHMLDTTQNKCLLDIKYKISTTIYNDDYSNYNNLLKNISMKLILICSNF